MVIGLGVWRITKVDKTVEASLYVVYIVTSRPEVSGRTDVRYDMLLSLTGLYDVEIDPRDERLALAGCSESEVR
jgi:hypothetical protein